MGGGGGILEEWIAPGAVKGDVLMGSRVIRKFGRPYHIDKDIIIVALNAIYLKDINFLLHLSFINTNST